MAKYVYRSVHLDLETWKVLHDIKNAKVKENPAVFISFPTIIKEALFALKRENHDGRRKDK